MRNVALALLAAAGLAVSWNGPAKAVGTSHPFCIQGDESPGLSNCTFNSYDQCMATASGRFLTCIENPFFGGPAESPYPYRNRNRPSAPPYSAR